MGLDESGSGYQGRRAGGRADGQATTKKAMEVKRARISEASLYIHSSEIGDKTYQQFTDIYAGVSKYYLSRCLCCTVVNKGPNLNLPIYLTQPSLWASSAFL